MPSTRSDHRPNKVGSLISFRLDVFEPQRASASAIVRRPPQRIGPKDRSSVSAKQTKKTPVFLDQLLEIMSDDVRSGASIQRIRQMKDKSLKQQIVVTDRASFQNQTLSHLRPARPSMPSMGSAPNNQALKPDHLEASRHIFSSQSNIQQASTPKGSCKPYFPESHPIGCHKGANSWWS